MRHVMVCTFHKSDNADALKELEKNCKDHGVIFNFHADLSGTKLVKKTGICPGSSDGSSP